MLIINVDQNSEEWFEERKGSITGTRPKKLFIEKIASKDKMIQSILFTNNLDDDEQKALKKLSNVELEEMLSKEEHDKFWYRAQKKEYWRVLGEMAGYISEEEQTGIWEDPRDRGHRLEDTAVRFLEKHENIKTAKVGICAREDYDEIRISPDRLIASDPFIELDDDGNILNADANDYRFVGGVEIKNPGIVNHLETIFCQWVPDEYWLQIIQYFVVTDVDYVYYVSHCPEVTDKPLYFIKINRQDVLDDIAKSLAQQLIIIKHLKDDVLQLTF